MRHVPPASRLALVALAGLVAGASAQDIAGSGPADAGTPEPRDPLDNVGFFVDGGVQWSSPADLDDASGDVAVTRLSAGGGVSFKVSDKSMLILRGSARFSFYEFDNAAGVIPSLPAVAEPFDDAYALTFSPLLSVNADEDWRWFVGGRVRSAGEPDADFGDTLIGGGVAGASYRVNDNLRLGLAVNVNSRLEGGVWVFPIPIIEWDITDKLALRSREGGVALEYGLNDAWTLGLRGGFERHEFRLADDNLVPGGSVTDRRIPVGLVVTYAPSRRVSVTGLVGSDVWGSLDFHNASGNEIADTDLGSDLLVGFDLRITF